VAATNLGQLSVDIIANIGNLQRGLNSAAQLINRFAQRTSQQVQTGTKFMGSQYDKFAVSVQKTAQTVQKTQTPLINAVNQTTKGIQRNTQVLSRGFSTIKKGGTTLDKTTKKLQHFGEGFGNIGKRMSSFIRFNIAWFATWRLMWGALRAIKAGVAAIVEFDTAMTNLGAITGATQEQLLKLEDTAREVGATTRFTAVETATAMVDLSKAGFSVSEVNQMIAGTAELAIGTLSELTQTTQLVATTLRTFSLQAIDATEVANIFAAAITNSRLTIEGLRNSMKYIGPIMAEIGYSLEDTAAVLGVLADRGLEAGISARGLRGFFSALIAPSAKLRKEIERVGLSMNDVSPLANDLGDILFRLKEAGFDVESAMRGLERRVGTTAVALIGAGEYFNVLRDAITATTAAEVISERQTTSLGYRIKLIKSEATELALGFRDLLLPGIVGVMSSVSNLLQIFGDFFSMINAINDILPEFVRNMLSLATATGETKDAMTGILALAPFLYDQFKSAKEELTDLRKEIAGSVFDLNKQLTELARTAIALGEYKDDEVKLRTALEGLADTYPEIMTLLMRENVTYEAAIILINELTETKKKEIKVRGVDLIDAIKTELIFLRKEAGEIEELKKRIEEANAIEKIGLKVRLAAREASWRSYDALIKNIRLLESTLRILTRTEEEQVEVAIKHGEGFVKSAKDELDLAKKRKASVRELLPLYDKVIKLQQEQSAGLLENIQNEWKAVEKREKRELDWIEVMDDPTVGEAYNSWIKSEKNLITLMSEKGEILKNIQDQVFDIVAEEDKLFEAVRKREQAEIDYHLHNLLLIDSEMKTTKEKFDLINKLEEEEAQRYAELQNEGYESFTKILDLKLQQSLVTGKKETEVIKEAQELFAKWGHIFDIVATEGYQASLKWTKAWAKEPIGLREGIFIPDIEEEKKRIEKAFREYRDIMLEFDVSVGRERRWTLIMNMQARLDDTKYWLNKDLTARLAFEKTLIGLHQETNKEIIAEAKETAKTDLSLALETLTKRRQYLDDYVKQYPILAKEIINTIQSLIPATDEIDEALKESNDKLFEMRVDTSEKVIALAAKETEEKIIFWQKELKNLKALEQAGIDVSERRLKITQILANLESVADEERLNKKYELEENYLNQYVITAKAGLKKVTISSEESYREALNSEEERYNDGLRALESAAKENIMIFENQAELRERIMNIHNENIEKINEAHRQYELRQEREIEDATMAYHRQINQATIQDEIEMLEGWLETYKLTKEEELAIFLRIAALEKEIAEENYAIWIAQHDLRVAFAKDNLEALKLEMGRRLEILRHLERTGAVESDILQARLSFYQGLMEIEKEWIRLAKERGLTNAEIEAEMRALWMRYHKDMDLTEEEATVLFEEHWKKLLKTMGLVFETIQGRWDNLTKRLVNRLKEWLRNSKGELSDWALFISEIFDFALNKIANAFAELFRYILEGGSRALELSKDQTLEKLATVERALEAEARAHGRFTDRYKELLDAQQDAQQELADTEFELLKERTAWWRNFINAIIAEIGRLIAYLIAKAAVIAILRFLGIPIPSFSKGGEVKVPKNIPELRKGGLVQSINKGLQSLQKGGEVMVRAHEGEYFIPSPLVKQIKRTGEVPESLTEAIVAGKPPSFQKGGEVGIGGEEGAANLIVHFHPGTQFTEENKVKTRMWFTETILPLYRETVRRG